MPRRVSGLFPATATSMPPWSLCQKFLISVSLSMVSMITSRQNPRLKDIRRLRRSKGDHALLEGPHLVGEAAAAGIGLETVLATPAWLETPEGRELASKHSCLEVAPELLDELTDADS